MRTFAIVYVSRCKNFAKIVKNRYRFNREKKYSAGRFCTVFAYRCYFTLRRLFNIYFISGVHYAQSHRRLTDGRCGATVSIFSKEDFLWKKRA